MEIGFHTFPNGKQYAFIKHGKSRTFLRNILFLTNVKNPKEIAIVHEWGSPVKYSWEPPKGQMEWKEFAESGIKAGSIISQSTLTMFQKEGVIREMVEEAKIFPSEIKHLTKLPIAYEQDWPESKLPHAHFQYQFWHASTTHSVMIKAQKRIQTLVKHIDWKHLLPADVTEKDAIQWWNPDSDGWDLIRGEFSKKMTTLYFDFIKS
jgi:hypothetical protein